MPTYVELAQESWYVAEYEPAPLAAFNAKLRAFFGHSKSQTGSKGDNKHLKGRHRSRNWDLYSRYCTNRSYATTDPRDIRGPGDALRATDVGIQGTALYAASIRLDAAVRAGKLPGIAEWFGTKDGQSVVGWFEGHASTSDDSHLWHLHLGYWTESTLDPALFEALYPIITGEDMDTRQDALLYNASSIAAQIARMADTAPVKRMDGTDSPPLVMEVVTAIETIGGGVAELLARPPVAPAPIDPAELAAAVRAALLDPEVTAAMAKAVNDDHAARMAG